MSELFQILGLIALCFVSGIGAGIGLSFGMEIAMRWSGDNRTVILTFARNVSRPKDFE